MKVWRAQRDNKHIMRPLSPKSHATSVAKDRFIPARLGIYLLHPTSLWVLAINFPSRGLHSIMFCDDSSVMTCPIRYHMMVEVLLVVMGFPSIIRKSSIP